MGKPICADYQTPFLLPPSLEDWIPANHPARFIRHFVESLPWEQLGFRAQPCLEGRPPYANEMLLKVWLFGYLHKVRSVRALEKACYEQISLLWLTGLHYPDHNTLWRFWRDNKGALHNVFRQSVKVAVQAGLVSLALQALDGTRIQAACSGRSAWTVEQMQALHEALEQEIALTEQSLEQEAKEPWAPAYALPAELSESSRLKQKIQEGLAQLQGSQRQHYHPDEPQAPRMKCEGRSRFGYNAQAVVDEKVGVITAAEVLTKENETGQLVPMLEQAQRNVGARAQENVADAGYGRGTDLLAAQEKGFSVTTAVVDSGHDELYHSSKFAYEAQDRSLHCPRGEKLHREGTRTRYGQEVQIFRCKNRECPVKHLCTQDPKGRMVEIWASHEVLRKMREKLTTEAGRYALKRRRQTVELTFARVKQHFGFRRWTVRGLNNVRAQWSMLCLAMNLQLLMKAKRLCD